MKERIYSLSNTKIATLIHSLAVLSTLIHRTGACLCSTDLNRQSCREGNRAKGREGICLLSLHVSDRQDNNSFPNEARDLPFIRQDNLRSKERRGYIINTK